MRRLDINLEYYKIFYYVGKLGGISAAAEALSISQPAVSQAVKQLERALNNTLFIRTSKGVRLTREGETLFFYIKNGYETIKSGENMLKNIQNLETGEIRIGASDMTLQFYLLPFLEQFHEAYPKIKIHVTNAPTPSTIKYLQNGEIDFGVVSSPFENRKGFFVRPVRKIEDVFVGGEKYAYLKEKILSYKNLEKLPILCLEENTSTRRYVDHFLRQRGVFLNPEFELATSDMLVQFALRNLGIASVTQDFAKKHEKDGSLFVLKFEEPIPEREFCIVSDVHIPLSAAAKRLLEQMKEQGENIV